MDNQSWQENEIAQAYDAKFQMLEAARKEYEQAVISLLDEIQVTLMTKQSRDALAEGVVLEVDLKDGFGFARQALECGLKVGSDSSRIQVVSRLATPWVNTPGLLQLGVATTLDRWISSSPETLRRAAEKEGLWDQEPVRSEHLGKAKGESDWIHEETIALTDSELVEVAAERVRQLLIPASELALQIDQEHRLAQRLEKVLERVRKGLEDSDWNSGYEVQPRVGWWKGMRYAQINLKNQPCYWVGYHVTRKCLMYGHNRSEQCSELATKFAAAVSCPRTEVYGGLPAGVLFDESEIEKTTDDDLVKQTGATFRLFEKTVKECA